MEIKTKNSLSICKLFLHYLIGLSTATIALIMGTVILVSIFFQCGFILPANYSEIELNHLADLLTDQFDDNLLPPYCDYIIIDVNGNIEETNMTEKQVKKMKLHLSTGKRAYFDVYKQITQKNGNLIIIKYDMLVHFRNKTLHNMIPYPEFSIILLLIGLIILFVIITAYKFSRKLKKNLNPIIVATTKIGNRDLEFDIASTEISEFNSVLDTINKLKIALSFSLKEQWNKEQQKKSQLSALAHDIKTPLTVIRGNAELLAENSLSQDDEELVSYIKSSSETIEKYLELLMNVVNNNSISIDKRNLSLDEFIQNIFHEAEPICKSKTIKLNVMNDIGYSLIYVDGELLKRAIINIIDNAVRNSDIDSQISFIISENNSCFLFEIADCGVGFSDESLLKATDEFYTEDCSRTNHHYGLGLSFAKTVAELHGGNLKFKNKTKENGAIVTITIEKIESTLPNHLCV